MECQSVTHATQKKCLLQPDFLHWNIVVIYSWDIWSFWNISVICLTVVLKLTIKVFLAYIFKHSDQNDSIYFGHFKNVSVCDQNIKQIAATVLNKLKGYWKCLSQFLCFGKIELNVINNTFSCRPNIATHFHVGQHRLLAWCIGWFYTTVCLHG